MGFIPKELVIKAYKSLSNLTSDHKQGQTQVVSLLRYVCALDRYCVSMKTDNCDLNITNCRDAFTENVVSVVNIEGDWYSTNFYDGVKQLEDVGVGSNFYSAGVVAKSKENKSNLYDYPTRGNNPVFQVKSNVLYRKLNLYKNISNSLFDDDLKCGFVIWLSRNNEIEDLTYNGIWNGLLKSSYSNDLLNVLFPKSEFFDVYIDGYNIETTHSLLRCGDIPFIQTNNQSLLAGNDRLFMKEEMSDNHKIILTALRTKPFLLLAGISGTGKSRIVRELARACWKSDDPEYKAHKPRNFEMVQVKPNWHDSSELIGYVSRIGEKPEFIAGEFIKFVAKAWSEPNVPYFLCLDEMNLAPVEQYFAEYLSVIESRELKDGKIVTDPLLRKEAQEWYHTLVSTLTDDEDLHEQFLSEGITIPQNLFVIGTVNMDETTFSFSRKVLDRAMTIEMNEVDLTGGLETDAENEFGYIGPSEDGTASRLIPQVVEGKDVYSANKELCGKVIEFLTSVNQVLDKTPFKIAYRTRNEFLVYAVCRDEENLSNALDEMTSMKILSRIEGDVEKTERVLNDLSALLKTTFGELDKSVSLIKIEEMMEKLNRTQYTSFWS